MIRIITALLLLSLIFIGCEWMETVETTYSNFEAASKDGAIGEKKLLPAFLPQSAKDIRQAYNIDTNEIWLFFNFSVHDKHSITNTCQKIAEPEVIYPRKSPRSWWPQTLTKRSKDTKSLSKVYEYYRCKDGGIVAIHGDEVFYWHSGRL